jgi:murein hydrolase activator
MHFRSLLTKYILPAAFTLSLTAVSMPADARKTKTAVRTEQKKSTRKTSSSSKTRKKSSNTGRSKKSASSGKAQSTPRTAEEARRRQAETQKEIARTQEELKRNEAQVKKGLSELNRLSGDITAGRQLVAKATEQVQEIDERIESLQVQISNSENQLAKMRADYLKSIKKIRSRRGSASALTFVFASKNFSQAMQRIRYLKQIGDWRDKKSAQIQASVKELSNQKAELEQSRQQKDIALSRQVSAQNKLNSQYQKQDALIAELKANGKSLRSHLAKKQKEAYALKNRIAALIAEENRKAEEARRAEEAKRAEEARLAEANRKAEEEKLLAREAENKAENSKDKKKQQKEEKARKSKVRKNMDYAEARRRKPRTPSSTDKTSGNSTESASAARTSVAGNFAAMRGSLPRPVSGEFRVTSQFGRHSLPELPDVMYDNPGIDAETAAGASAQAVYGGKVSGVYVIPGYSTVIIINHGNYYTVYGNIASPSVKIGDVVKQGQALGRLTPGEDDSSHSTIHFEVWKNRDKLNPLDWIR